MQNITCVLYQTISYEIFAQTSKIEKEIPRNFTLFVFPYSAFFAGDIIEAEDVDQGKNK